MYFANALAIIGGTPMAESPFKLGGKSALALADWQRGHPEIAVVVASTVSPTSWLKLPSTGTVPLLGDDRILINDPALHGEWPIEYVLNHELHHLQQVDLVESMAIGEPSIWNPVATASHYVTFGRLSSDLNRIYGEDRFSNLGVERASDCYATWIEKSTAGKAGAAYGAANSCTPIRVAASIAISEGDWPSATAIQVRLERATDLLSNESGRKAGHP